jgi:chromosome segregation ATPase
MPFGTVDNTCLGEAIEYSGEAYKAQHPVSDLKKKVANLGKGLITAQDQLKTLNDKFETAQADAVEVFEKLHSENLKLEHQLKDTKSKLTTANIQKDLGNETIKKYKQIIENLSEKIHKGRSDSEIEIDRLKSQSEIEIHRLKSQRDLLVKSLITITAVSVAIFAVLMGKAQ